MKIMGNRYKGHRENKREKRKKREIGRMRWNRWDGYRPMEGIGVGFLKDFEVVLSTDGDIFMRANFFSCAD